MAASEKNQEDVRILFQAVDYLVISVGLAGLPSHLLDKYYHRLDYVLVRCQSDKVILNISGSSLLGESIRRACGNS